MGYVSWNDYSAPLSPTEVNKVNQDFESFSMYGFSVNYPDKSKVIFNSKSRREAGDVVFHLPEDIRIYLSWGELEKVRKRFFSTEEHANYSIDAMKNGKRVSNFERVSRDTISLHDHYGSMNKVRFDEKVIGVLSRNKAIRREAYSLHVHCDKSNRYFVLYTMAPAEDEARFDRIIGSMRDSFKCH